jgi:hypothetical protein
MVDPVSIKLSDIKFETGIRKDASLVFVVLQKNDKLPDGLTAKNIETALIKLKNTNESAYRLLMQAVTAHTNDNLNASQNELGKIAEALKSFDVSKFTLDDKKVKLTIDAELIDGIDVSGGTVQSDAKLAEVTGDYDAFAKEMLNIQPPPNAPPKVEAEEKIISPAKKKIALSDLFEKAFKGTLTVADIDKTPLPKDVEDIFVSIQGETNTEISAEQKVAILKELGSQGFLGTADDYKNDKSGVFSERGTELGNKPTIAFATEFFNRPGTKLQVNQSDLQAAVHSLCRSFEINKKLGRGIGEFAVYAKEFISASAYSVTKISKTTEGAATNLSEKLSGSGRPGLNSGQLKGLATAYAGATFNQQTNLPISNGSGAQITIDPKDDKKVVLSVKVGDAFKPVMSFAKADLDQIVEGTKDEREGKDLWFLNFLEFMTQEKDDKVQTWGNKKITDKTYIKDGKTIEIKDVNKPFQEAVNGITGGEVESIGFKDSQDKETQISCLKLNGFTMSGIERGSNGIVRDMTVNVETKQFFVIARGEDKGPFKFYLAEKSPAGGIQPSTLPNGNNKLTFTIGGVSVSKEVNVGASADTSKPVTDPSRKTPLELGSPPALRSGVAMPKIVPGMSIKLDEVYGESKDLAYSLDIGSKSIYPVSNGRIIIPEVGQSLTSDPKGETLTVNESQLVISRIANQKLVPNTNTTPIKIIDPGSLTFEDLKALILSPLGTEENISIYLSGNNSMITKGNIGEIVGLLKGKPQILAKLLEWLSTAPAIPPTSPSLNLVKIENNIVVDVVANSGIADGVKGAINKLTPDEISAVFKNGSDNPSVILLVKGWFDNATDPQKSAFINISHQLLGKLKIDSKVLAGLAKEDPSLASLSGMEDDTAKIVISGLLKETTPPADYSKLIKLIKSDTGRFTGLLQQLQKEQPDLKVSLNCTKALVAGLSADELKVEKDGSTTLASLILKDLKSADVISISKDLDNAKLTVVLIVAKEGRAEVMKEILDAGSDKKYSKFLAFYKADPKNAVLVLSMIKDDKGAMGALENALKNIDSAYLKDLLDVNSKSIAELFSLVKDKKEVMEKLKKNIAELSKVSANHLLLISFLKEMKTADYDKSFVASLNSFLDLTFKAEIKKISAVGASGLLGAIRSLQS